MGPGKSGGNIIEMLEKSGIFWEENSANPDFNERNVKTYHESPFSVIYDVNFIYYNVIFTTQKWK